MKNKAFIIAWVVSLIATLGSLYFSEIKGFIPCTICWYQRILMYPIVIQLGVSIITRDFNIKKYILALSIPGFLLALYHVILQKSFFLQSFEPCEIGVSCSSSYINWFGFITISVLSLTAFFIITISLLSYKKEGVPSVRIRCRREL